MGLFQKPKFLSSNDMEKIHEASLHLLEKKGVIFKSVEAVEILKKHGARVDGECVLFPRSLVEKCLRQVPAKFRMEAINPDRSVVIGEGLIIHPAGGEVFLKQADGNRKLQSKMRDFEDLQKIYQACDNMDMAGYQPLSPIDVPLKTRNLRCLYASMLYSDKPWLAPMDCNSGEEKKKELHMYEMVFGEKFVKDHYVTWSIVTPESPLIYSKFSCESIIQFAKYNQPVALVSAPMSGITSPIHIVGTIVQANVETLAGLCLAQCVKAGVPVLPSASLTYGNLQYATWECASPDTSLMLAGMIQMYKEFYHLPTRAQTGVTSSKCVDYQAGMETMQSLMLTALMDVDVTSQSAGSLENLMTISFEKTIIDDELISRVKYIMDGINVNDKSLSVDQIMKKHPGHDYLINDETLDHMYEFWRPQVSDWNSYEKWEELQQKDIEQRAKIKVDEILRKSKPVLELGVSNDLKKYIQRYEE